MGSLDFSVGSLHFSVRSLDFFVRSLHFLPIYIVMTTENEPPHPTLPTPNPLRRTQKLGVGSVGCVGCLFDKQLYTYMTQTYSEGPYFETQKKKRITVGL